MHRPHGSLYVLVHCPELAIFLRSLAGRQRVAFYWMCRDSRTCLISTELQYCMDESKMPVHRRIPWTTSLLAGISTPESAIDRPSVKGKVRVNEAAWVISSQSPLQDAWAPLA